MFEYLDRRYALALYRVAEEKDRVGQYVCDLREICSLIDNNKEFRDVIKHPQIGTEKKKNTFINIFKGNIDDELLSFLLLLIDKGRILYLKEKLNEFEKIILEENNVYKGYVKTSVPLTKKQFESLVEKLELKYKKTIILEQIIDTTILGGIYVKVNNEVLDGTVKLKLNELKELMLNAE